jgi:hypothetical protein
MIYSLLTEEVGADDDDTDTGDEEAGSVHRVVGNDDDDDDDDDDYDYDSQAEDYDDDCVSVRSALSTVGVLSVTDPATVVLCLNEKHFDVSAGAHVE